MHPYKYLVVENTFRLTTPVTRFWAMVTASTNSLTPNAEITPVLRQADDHRPAAWRLEMTLGKKTDKDLVQFCSSRRGEEAADEGNDHE
jgi:hypothetical protein